MKRIFRIITAVVVPVMFFACQEKVETPADNTLEVTPSGDITLDCRGENETVLTVKTDADSWDFTATDWIRVVKKENTLTVNADPNKTETPRSGKIEITAGNAPAVTVNVAQDAWVESFVTLSSETVEAPFGGGDFEITVTCAEDWKIVANGTAPDWCSVAPEEGKSGDKIVFTVSENTGAEARSAKYVVSSGSAFKTVTVTSAPTPYLELAEPASGELKADYSKAEFKVTIRTNLTADDIKCDIPEDASWVSLKGEPAVSGDRISYTVVVSPNAAYQARNAEISFSSASVTPVKVSVSQNMKPGLILVEPESGVLELGTESAKVNVTVSSNLPYKVSLPEWISQSGEPEKTSEGNGLTTYRYTFDVSAADGTRAGDIAFAYEQYSVSVSVKQIAEGTVKANIPDKTFRDALAKHGWIIADGDNTEVEVTATGLAATSLDFDAWFVRSVRSIEGIEAFSNLEYISFNGCNSLAVIDLSGLTNVNTLIMGTAGYVERIILGNNPVTSLNYGWETTVFASSVSISGAKLQMLNVSYQSWPMGDTWTTLDVTGCPELTTIYSQRPASLLIYVTAEQKDKIQNTGNGVLTVK